MKLIIGNWQSTVGSWKLEVWIKHFQFQLKIKGCSTIEEQSFSMFVILFNKQFFNTIITGTTYFYEV